MELSYAEKRFENALKSVARNLDIKEYVQNSKDLYPLFQRSAKRFVTGETREEGIAVGAQLSEKGYDISLEFIGENTMEREACRQAKDEFVTMMQACGHQNLRSRISFDLSHIGLSVDPELALEHLLEMAAEAERYDLSLMISMEESGKTDDILEVYKKAVTQYEHIGVTLQAQLHRTLDDLQELLTYPGAVRLVKGAYQEPEELHIPRSETLDERFMELVQLCIQADFPVSVASHDETIYQQLMKRGCFEHSYVEAELLYGIRPDVCRRLKEKGVPVRVYLTYGQEWYLYLVHRIAEYPPNIYAAITDMIEGVEDIPALY
ncbi:proline dehydrogenase [Salibacterium salarium]|uniref:proline dehydrogenase n=1 Tax=Salibacterium salarium TaxID=284579 RepID=A0A3R9QGX1_9BACI|nr:proline dehydrogenase family protein [Salibacterium salarium]MDQ0300532.1 proline dehydrogenase [Salibacterium salarium]RSL30266.1 proline dehydrogenase [Salibacterium salarium]